VEAEKCKECGSDLIYTPWNSVVDVATCNNTHCKFYRNPIPVALGTHEVVTTRAPLKRGAKSRWAFGENDEQERILENLRAMRKSLLDKE